MRSHTKAAVRLYAVIALVSGLALGGCAGNAASTDGASGSDDVAPNVSTEAPQGSVTIAVIGPNAEGEDAAYVAETSYDLGDVEDAWALSQSAFDDGGLVYEASNSDYGVLLDSITNPATGEVLAFDEASGKYWQLFVDGEASEVGIDGVDLADGTSVVWYYSAFGDAVPDEVTLAPLEPLADAA